ncbi:MAG: hypothetical protein QXR30_03595 [Candidatus Woesearchaeota archaeon]
MITTRISQNIVDKIKKTKDAEVRHNLLIDGLKERLEHIALSHNSLEKIIFGSTEEFMLSSMRKGEVDLYYVDLEKKYAVVVEVKSTQKESKENYARFQLLKDIEYLKKKYGIEEVWCLSAFVNYDRNSKGVLVHPEVKLEFHSNKNGIYDFMKKNYINKNFKNFDDFDYSHFMNYCKA